MTEPSTPEPAAPRPSTSDVESTVAPDEDRAVAGEENPFPDDDRRTSGVDPASVHEDRASSGDDRVDAATAQLEELAALPLDEHVAVFDGVHRSLHDTLASIDGS